MFRRRFRGSRRMRRGKREYVWVTSFGSVFAPGDGISRTAVLVTPADWARDPSATATLEKGAVLVRVVGDLCVSYEADNAPPNAVDVNYWTAAIRKHDEEDVNQPDFGAGSGFNEDWMHVEFGNVQRTVESVATLTWAAADFSSMDRRKVDIRVKRKLNSDENVSLYFGTIPPGAGDPATELSLFYGLRALIQLP